MHSKDEASNFNLDIANTDDFKYFKYKARLLQNTAAQPASIAVNGILNNVTIAMTLKYLSNAID